PDIGYLPESFESPALSPDPFLLPCRTGSGFKIWGLIITSATRHIWRGKGVRPALLFFCQRPVFKDKFKQKYQ
ncbi:MAG TPA: hypothetical protein VJ936_04925, partial [Desulfobacteraceae bacterium]|nr:hypothetical protein [Desulfobacteraceae bacterium]